MTDLTAHGIEVTLPSGWEGRVFRRPSAGEVVGRRRRRSARARGRDDPRGAPRVDDRAPAGPRRLRQRRGRQARPRRRVRSCSSSTTRRASTSRCSRAAGLPQVLTADDFSPNVHAARHPGPGRRAAVLPRPGSRVLPLRGARLVRPPASSWCRAVNEVLATLTIDQLDATGAADDGFDHDRTSHHRRAHHRRPDDRRRPRPPSPRPRRPGRRRQHPVSVLAGPFAIAAVLLAVGGAAKAVRPRDTAQALTAVGIRFPRVLPARVVVRIGGAVEAVIGVAALLVGGPVLCALVALSYLAFAGFVRRRAAHRRADQLVRLLRQGRHAAEPRARRARPRVRGCRRGCRVHSATSRCPTCSATSRCSGSRS